MNIPAKKWLGASLLTLDQDSGNQPHHSARIKQTSDDHEFEDSEENEPHIETPDHQGLEVFDEDDFDDEFDDDFEEELEDEYDLDAFERT